MQSEDTVKKSQSYKKTSYEKQTRVSEAESQGGDGSEDLIFFISL